MVAEQLERLMCIWVPDPLNSTHEDQLVPLLSVFPALVRQVCQITSTVTVLESSEVGERFHAHADAWPDTALFSGWVDRSVGGHADLSRSPNRTLEPDRSHESGHPALPAGHLAITQLLVDARGPIGALGLFVDGGDLLEQLGVGQLSLGRGAIAALVVGGTGDLEQSTRLVDAAACNLLRLDEGMQLHRVS